MRLSLKKCDIYNFIEKTMDRISEDTDIKVKIKEDQLPDMEDLYKIFSKFRGSIRCAEKNIAKDLFKLFSETHCYRVDTPEYSFEYTQSGIFGVDCFSFSSFSSDYELDGEFIELIESFIEKRKPPVYEWSDVLNRENITNLPNSVLFRGEINPYASEHIAYVTGDITEVHVDINSIFFKYVSEGFDDAREGIREMFPNAEDINFHNLCSYLDELLNSPPEDVAETKRELRKVVRLVRDELTEEEIEKIKEIM